MMDNNEEKEMVLGLENTDPGSDGTRIVIQEQLETGNVDLLSQTRTLSSNFDPTSKIRQGNVAISLAGPVTTCRLYFGQRVAI